MEASIVEIVKVVGLDGIPGGVSGSVVRVRKCPLWNGGLGERVVESDHNHVIIPKLEVLTSIPFIP